MPGLRDARYLNIFTLFFVCTTFGLVISIFAPISKSAVFLIVLFGLAALGIGRATNRQGMTRTTAYDMLLWGLPPLISGVYAVVQDRFDWSLAPFFIVYLVQAFVLGSANDIAERKLHLWTMTMGAAMLICLPFGVASLLVHGTFSPFTLFDRFDGTFSKNVFGILLFSCMIFWTFWYRRAERGSYPHMAIIFLVMSLATESRGLLLALIYLFATVVFSMSFRVLAAPTIAIVALIVLPTVNWDANSENRLIRLGDTIQKVVTRQIYDDGNNDLYRLTIMVSAYQAWNQNKAFGLGPGHDKIGVANNVDSVGFASQRITEKVGEKEWGTHNFYLKIMVEYGFLALLVLVYFWRLAVRLRPISPVLFHGFIAKLIFSATNNVPTGIIFFPVIFLFQAISLCSSIRPAAAVKYRQRRARRLASPARQTV